MMIELIKPNFFDLDITMDSEQCPVTSYFWKREGNGKYSRLCRKGNISYKLTLFQESESLIIKLTPRKTQQLTLDISDHAKKLIIKQFRLDDDFECILKHVKKWPEISNLFSSFPGLRVVNGTDALPTIYDSICSQNSSIKQLDKIMNFLSERYGEKILFNDESVFYSFPSLNTLAQISFEDLQACKLGYRAKYIHKSSNIISDLLGECINLDILPLVEAQKIVESIPGVGPKVGALILMYCFGRTDVFPVDVWISRGLKSLYGWNEKPVVLQKKAENKFLEYSSYVSNVLFYAYRIGLS